jgi:hypothetical protein
MTTRKDMMLRKSLAKVPSLRLPVSRKHSGPDTDRGGPARGPSESILESRRTCAATGARGTVAGVHGIRLLVGHGRHDSESA